MARDSGDCSMCSRFGGSSEVKLLSYGDKIAQVTQFHIRVYEKAQVRRA